MPDNKSSRLLIDEQPLVILPKLAALIGLNEAVFVQQLHYWLHHYRNDQSKYHDGRLWIYNTYEDWHKNFPFWNIRTVRRTIIKLEQQRLVLSKNLNRYRTIRTKSYTLDYARIRALSEGATSISRDPDRMDILAISTGKDGHLQLANLDTLLSENTTKNTSETTKNIVSRSSARSINELLSKAFCLRPDEYEFALLADCIERMSRSDHRHRWIGNRKSLETLLRGLIYSNLPKCRTIQESDKKKTSILLEMNNIYHDKMNWLCYVIDCIRYTSVAFNKQNVKQPIGFVRSLRMKPGLLISALSDGELSKGERREEDIES